jgi:hypothetical protein
MANRPARFKEILDFINRYCERKIRNKYFERLFAVIFRRICRIKGLVVGFLCVLIKILFLLLLSFSRRVFVWVVSVAEGLLDIFSLIVRNHNV